MSARHPFEPGAVFFIREAALFCMWMQLGCSGQGGKSGYHGPRITTNQANALLPMKVALCSIATGPDPLYFRSVARYLPYNLANIAPGHEVDFLLFTDRDEDIDGVRRIACDTVLWPYCTNLKNNIIGDWFEREGRWDDYDFIFFVDADFALGEPYDYFAHEFVMMKAYWGKHLMAGGFYGGKSEWFRRLYMEYRDELRFIREHMLPVPQYNDERYLTLFADKYKDSVHVIDMNDHLIIFYDNEDLDEVIAKRGTQLFLQPYKSAGMANGGVIKHPSWECKGIINLEEKYIYIVCHNDMGRLQKLDDTHYRIHWYGHNTVREILNVETGTIELMS